MRGDSGAPGVGRRFIHKLSLLLGQVPGVLRSTDDDATWSAAVEGLPNGGLAPLPGWSLVLAPGNAQGSASALLAASKFGVFRSDDGTSTWTEILPPPELSSGATATLVTREGTSLVSFM